MRLRPPRSLRGRDSPLWLPVQGCYRVGIIAAQLHASEVPVGALWQWPGRFARDWFPGIG
jgi:hypothetical protein